MFAPRDDLMPTGTTEPEGAADSDTEPTLTLEDELAKARHARTSRA